MYSLRAHLYPPSKACLDKPDDLVEDYAVIINKFNKLNKADMDERKLRARKVVRYFKPEYENEKAF